MKPHVVVLGSGYVTVWTYRALRRRFGNKIDFTVISPYDFHTYHGFTGEVLGGEVATHWQESSLAEATPHARHVAGRAVLVDSSSRTVTVEGEDGISQVGYDYLVIGTGAVEYADKVPGLSQYALPMQSAGKPAAVVARLNENLVKAALSTDVAAAERLSTVVVIGAGLAGTETSAALSRRLKATGRNGRVILICTTEAPIAQWKDKPVLQRAAMRALVKDGVQVMTSARVTRVDSNRVLLSDGTTIDAGLIVNAAGTHAVIPEGLQHLRAASGRLAVGPDLSVAERIWAAGDVAEVLRPNGEPAPKDALWALRAGTGVGRNIARAIKGKAWKPFKYSELGVVTTFGTGSAVGHMKGVPLTGWVSWSMSGLIFLWFLPSRPQALRMMKSMMAGTVGDPALKNSGARIPAQGRRRVRQDVRS